MTDYEVVVGVEVHAELSTQTKLFCGCDNQFGDTPNTHTCPICIGMPGVLPVMNKKAFDLVLKAACALQCEVPEQMCFDRKNYYYPDLPKNYQISQGSVNLGINGYLDIPTANGVKRINIHNVHIEEDAGKLIHPEGGERNYTQVDLNRAGVPLVEIVSAPDMRSVDEVDAYMETLRNLLLCLDVSDCKMQEGRLRFEASISLRPHGETELGPRVEVKNLNSMRAVRHVLEYEIDRQSKCLDQGERVIQETRLWDDRAGKSAVMRRKEDAQDYRYFPEPDLLPVRVSREWFNEVRQALPELPFTRRNRLVEELKIPDYDAAIITADCALADYFEQCIQHGAQAKAAANFLLNEMLKIRNEKKLAVRDFPVSPANAAELITLVQKGAISRNNFAKVLEGMLSGKRAQEVVEAEGLGQISDASELEAIVQKVMDANPQPVNDLRNGKKQAQSAIMGQIMRETRGKANPALVSQLIQKLL